MSKIKNASEKDFSFEGTSIPAGQTAELPNEVVGRLLALYWHNPLEPVEETPAQPKVPEEESSIIEDEPEEDDGLEEE
jgi:hypothetical protein